MSLRDNKSGFVCATREVLEDLLTYEGKYFYWQSFIMVAAHAKGYEYKEIEVLFDKRRQGTSFLDTQAYRASLRSFVDLGRAVVEYRVRQRPRQTERLEKRAHEMLAAPLPPSPQKYPLRWRAYMATFDQTHWTITRDVERYYESLHRTQWLSLASMRELQDEKLRRLVRHAYRNVPYYRARMQEVGLTPQDIHGQSDLHKLPFLTKDLVRKHLHFDIMSENHDRKDVLRIATSGRRASRGPLDDAPPPSGRRAEAGELGGGDGLRRGEAAISRSGRESGPTAIFHYQSGGSLGLLKYVNSYFFELFGPVTVKRGDICSGAGDAAQNRGLRRRGLQRRLRPPQRRNRIILWGKNVFTSSPAPHPDSPTGAAGRGADHGHRPIHTKTVSLSDRFIQPDPAATSRWPWRSPGSCSRRAGWIRIALGGAITLRPSRPWPAPAPPPRGVRTRMSLRPRRRAWPPSWGTAASDPPRRLGNGPEGQRCGHRPRRRCAGRDHRQRGRPGRRRLVLLQAPRGLRHLLREGRLRRAPDPLRALAWPRRSWLRRTLQSGPCG